MSLIIFSLFFISFSLFQLTGALVSIKFHTLYPKTSNMKNKSHTFDTKDYIKSIVLSEIYFELITGNETSMEKNKSQKLNIFIDSIDSFNIESEQNYAIDEDDYQNLCNYSLKLSDTYKKVDTKYAIGEETFKIYSDIHLSQYQYVKLLFYEDQYYDKDDSLCGRIGLDKNIFRIDQTNFLPQLVKKINVSEKIFFFKFKNDDPDEGNLIVGEMPHNCFKQEYNSNNLISFYTNYNVWSITLDSIILEGYNISSTDLYETIDVSLSFKYEGLVFSEDYITHLNNIFFNKYYEKKICMNVTVDYPSYTIISCDATHFGKDDIKNFPIITFIKYRSDLKFSFEPEELFYYRDNRYFLKIYRIQGKSKEFIFGKIFLQKYLTVFDFEKKQVSFYKTENEEKGKEEEENNLWIYLSIALSVAVVIFFIVGIFIGKKIYKARKKRANELHDDNYQYDAAINDENGKEKLYDEDNKETS